MAQKHKVGHPGYSGKYPRLSCLNLSRLGQQFAGDRGLIPRHGELCFVKRSGVKTSELVVCVPHVD